VSSSDGLHTVEATQEEKIDVFLNAVLLGETRCHAVTTAYPEGAVQSEAPGDKGYRGRQNYLPVITVRVAVRLKATNQWEAISSTSIYTRFG
jgi:hypothetical protein